MESACHDVWHPAGAQQWHFFSSSQLDAKYPEAKALLLACPSITWAPGPVPCIQGAENKRSSLVTKPLGCTGDTSCWVSHTCLLSQLPSALANVKNELSSSSPLLPTGQGHPGSLGNQYLKLHG